MSLLNKIKSIFTDKLFDILQSGDTYFEIQSKNRDNCLIIEFEGDIIHILNLAKCGDNKGSKILEMIHNLSMIMPNIRYIKLQDDSKYFECGISIDLAVVKILTNGESWYNSLGYYSEDYQDEKRYNTMIQELPLEELLFISLEKNKEICKQKYSKEKLLKILQTLFNELQNLPEELKVLSNPNYKTLNKVYEKNQQRLLDNEINFNKCIQNIQLQYDKFKESQLYSIREKTRDYVTFITEEIKQKNENNDDCKIHNKFLSELLLFIKPSIKYDVNLTKQVNRLLGGKKGRKSRKSRKGRKGRKGRKSKKNNKH